MMNINDDTLLIVAPDNIQIMIRNSLHQIPGLESVAESIEGKIFKKIYTHRFVLILLDLATNGIDTSRICAMLNSHKKIYNPPLIIIDSKPDPQKSDLTHLVESFPDLTIDFYFTPLDHAILTSKLAFYYDLYRLKTAVDQSRKELDIAFKKLMDQHDNAIADLSLQKKISLAFTMSANQIQHPLRTLWAALSQLQKSDQLSAKTLSAVSAIKNSAQRIDQLSKQSLNFSTKLSPESFFPFNDDREFKIVYAEASNEDFSLFHHLLKDSLPCRIIQTSSIEKTLSILGSHTIDMIFLSEQLSDGTGSALLKKIHQIYRDIPVIFLLNRSASHKGSDILSKGAFSFLTKEQLSTEALFSIIASTYTKTKIIREAESARDRITMFSSQDMLTRICNKHRFDELLSAEASKAQRYNAHLSMITIQFTGLPDIKARHGSSIADQVLIFAAALIRGMIRECDTVCRYYPDLFCILLPQTDMHGAQILSQRIKKKFKDVAFDHSNVVLSLTISIGVSAFDETKNISNAHQLLETAMDAVNLN